MIRGYLLVGSMMLVSSVQVYAAQGEHHKMQVASVMKVSARIIAPPKTENTKVAVMRTIEERWQNFCYDMVMNRYGCAHYGPKIRVSCLSIEYAKNTRE